MLVLLVLLLIFDYGSRGGNESVVSLIDDSIVACCSMGDTSVGTGGVLSSVLI